MHAEALGEAGLAEAERETQALYLGFAHGAHHTPANFSVSSA